MTSIATHESKFLDCWPKIKELRSEQVKKMWTAKERGELLIWSSPIPYTSFFAGFGEYLNTGGLGPNYTAVMTDRSLLNKCMQKVDAAGFGPNVCGMFRTTLGQILGNVYDVSLKTGKKADIDLFFDVHVCQGQVKSFQLWKDYYPGIHYVGIEAPHSDEHGDFLVMQMHEAVAEIEKITGRTYNDELAKEALRNEWAVHVLSARICELQKNIPAPLNARWLSSLSSLAVARAGAHKQDTVDAYKMFYEEAKERVRKGIGAVPVEKCRLIHEGVSSWYPSPVLRYPNSYGAVFILTGMNVTGMGAWKPSDDLSAEVAPEFDEMQLPLNTRDDIFRAMALLWLTYVRQVCTLEYYPRKLKQLLKAVEDWRVDGVVINRSMECRGLSGLADELALCLKEKGIPTLVYQGSPNTPLDFNKDRYIAQMDAFLEGFGLRPLPDFVPVEPPDYLEF